MRLERVIAIFGILSSLCVLIMLVAAIGFDVSQEAIEVVKPSGAYAESLLAQATGLRFVFTIDNFFILAYAGFFLAFVAERRTKVDGFVLGVAFTGFMLTTLLDVLENFHILTMLRAAELRLPLSDAAIQLQYVASATKFFVSYFAAMAFAWVLPRDTRLARTVAISTGIIYPVVGVLSYTTPMPWLLGFSISRVFFFVFAFATSSVVYWNRRPNEAGLEPPA